MPTTKRLTIDTVNFEDQREVDALDAHVIAIGMERVRAEGDELRRRGLLDEQGKVLATGLPADMKESSERDFGG